MFCFVARFRRGDHAYYDLRRGEISSEPLMIKSVKHWENKTESVPNY